MLHKLANCCKILFINFVFIACSNREEIKQQFQINKQNILNGSWVDEYSYLNFYDTSYHFTNDQINENISGLTLEYSDSAVEFNLIYGEYSKGFKINIDSSYFEDSVLNLCLCNKEKKCSEFLKLNLKDSSLFISNYIMKNVIDSKKEFQVFRKASSKKIGDFKLVRWCFHLLFLHKKYILKFENKKDELIQVNYNGSLFFTDLKRDVKFYLENIDYIIDNSVLKKNKVLLHLGKFNDQNWDWIPYIIVKNADESFDFFESNKQFIVKNKKFSIMPFKY